MVTSTTSIGETDYERGFRDGQEARRNDEQRREYERGFRDGYGSPSPFDPWRQPINPIAPVWGSPSIYGQEYTVTQATTPNVTFFN